MTLAVGVLLGWTFNITLLKSIVPGFVAMNPLTALCFLFIAVWQLHCRRNNSSNNSTPSWFTYLLAGFVLVVGALRLYDIMDGSAYSIDAMVFTSRVGKGHISPLTAFAFVCLGIAMLTFKVQQRKRSLVLFFITPVFAVSIVSFFGYIIGDSEIITSQPFVPMALHTAFCFLALVVSFLFLFPKNVVTETLLSDDFGGSIARRLLPYIIVVPLALGFFRYQGERLGLYETGFGVALTVVGAMLTFIVVVVRQSRAISLMDRERREAERSVEQRSKELMAANKELESKNKELEQFSYAASHDMQEPLRKVQTFSGLLLERNGEQLDERGREYVNKMTAAVGRMKTLIEDLLLYSQQSTYEREYIPIDLNTIIESIKSDLEMVIEQKGAVIRVEKLPVISGDPTQTRQLFYNLVTNALKFAAPGATPHVTISARIIGEEIFKQKPHLDSSKTFVEISVSDNGIGFRQEYASQIFNLFKRLHAKSDYEGTGIGLSLCKKIVENHGGDIWAEGKEGGGATFKLLLPQG